MQMEKYSIQDLQTIRRYAYVLAYLILASLPAHFFPPALILVGFLIFLLSYALAKADKLGRPWLWGVLCLLPLIGYVPCVVLLFKSARILKDNGVKDEIMEVEDSEEESA
jgi:hypothetical protein